MQYQVFWLPKDGNAPEEYEDAYARHEWQQVARFAIADGATESSFAKEWAGLLVEEFVKQQTQTDKMLSSRSWLTRILCVPRLRSTDRSRLDKLLSESWLTPLRHRWLAEVGGRELPWYAEPKFKAGAYATFLGFELHDPDQKQGTWDAVAVGDSCLFHWRESGELINNFPMKRSQEFGTTPSMLGSRTGINSIEKSKLMEGHWKAGDRFWLMTDALAKWCIQRIEEEKRPWEEVERLLADQGRFAEWIKSLWKTGDLRNDDITLAVIRLS